MKSESTEGSSGLSEDNFSYEALQTAKWDELERFTIEKVVFAGRLVVSDGICIAPVEHARLPEFSRKTILSIGAPLI